MATAFSLRSVLLRAPNELLKSYFESRDELRDFEWDRFALSATDPLFDACAALPDRSRDQIECELGAVHELATREGVARLVEQARAQGVDLAAEISTDGDHLAQAFAVFLRYRRVFDAARQLVRVDHLNGRFWRTRADLPRRVPDAGLVVRTALGEAVAAYFRQEHGPGCEVRRYLRGEKHVFVAYPQDAAEFVLGYEGGRLLELSRRPVFHVVFSFDPTSGTLELHAQGGARVHRDLQQIFARVMFDEELPPEPGIVAPYRLNLLRRRGFAFPTEPEDRIAEVRVKALRLAVMGRGGKIAVDAGALRDRVDVYDLMDRSLRTDALPLATVNVDDVTIQMVFAFAERPRVLTFGVTPRSCDLRDGPDHQVARRCLRRWRIACA